MHNRYDDIMENLGWYYLPQHIDATEKEIVDLEERIGTALPEDYREFVMKYGVVSTKTTATYPSPSDPSKVGVAVEVFFGMAKQPVYDLGCKSHGMSGRIPQHYLPIGASPGGLICIGLTGPNRGSVFWWDRAEEFDEPEKNIYLVAHTFDSFMKSLIPYKSGERSRRGK
jgi:hypothetical protein